MELASDVAERESCQQQLDCYGVLDTPPERDFNDLVEARRKARIARA